MPTHFCSGKTFSELAPRTRHAPRPLFALHQTQETSALQSQATIHTKLNSHQGVDGEQDSQLFGISWLFLALQCIRNENMSQYKKAMAAILGGNVAGFKSNWAAMSNLGGAALAERSRRVFVFVF